MEENKTIIENTEITEQTEAVKTETDVQTESLAQEIVDRIKEIVKEGNVTRVRIRKDDTMILNLPLSYGIVGTIIGAATAFWAVILAALTTVGMNCTVELEKKDGSIDVIYGNEA